MLEESLDPRPTLPLDFASALAGTVAPAAVPVELLAQAWNDNASFWRNLRTLEYWIDRAGR
ncbi:MAG: hypothetical protein RL030_389 [Pseudomonadota bacterium]|jgi:hypothetical protein